MAILALLLLIDPTYYHLQPPHPVDHSHPNISSTHPSMSLRPSQTESSPPDPYSPLGCHPLDPPTQLPRLF